MEVKENISFDIDKSVERMDAILSAGDDRFEDKEYIPSRRELDYENGYYVDAAALFIEEIACNTIEHGFTDAKRGSLDVRVIYSDDREIIRFRDDGRPFDPVKWLELNHPDDPLKGAGIRIVVGMAKEVRYMPAMGLNNLLIIL